MLKPKPRDFVPCLAIIIRAGADLELQFRGSEIAGWWIRAKEEGGSVLRCRTGGEGAVCERRTERGV